ncbi:hypothetical protein HK101_003373 [Irineochytrium annulatum]|nr:hypothetical protein HK101_003373 [Irineochytrium annulatum]
MGDPVLCSTLALCLMQEQAWPALLLLSSDFVSERFALMDSHDDDDKLHLFTWRHVINNRVSFSTQEEREEDARCQQRHMDALRSALRSFDPASASGSDAVAPQVRYRKWDDETTHAVVRFTGAGDTEPAVVLMKAGPNEWRYHDFKAVLTVRDAVAGTQSSSWEVDFPAAEWRETLEDACKAFEALSEDVAKAAAVAASSNATGDVEYWNNYDKVFTRGVIASKSSKTNSSTSLNKAAEAPADEDDEDDYWGDYDSAIPAY